MLVELGTGLYGMNVDLLSFLFFLFFLEEPDILAERANGSGGQTAG